MRVRFDPHTKIAGIGVLPWARLGLEQWFEAYKIASLYSWDVGQLPEVPEVYALAATSKVLPDLERVNTQHLLEDESFQNLLIEHLAEYHVVTYKSVSVPANLQAAGVRISCSDQALAQRLENKADFRALFADEHIPFPHYEVRERHGLEATAKAWDALAAGRQAVVIQDEALSGGKGTFILRHPADLQTALQTLEEISHSPRVVVSDLVAGARERSVQGVVTRQGVFIGPLQKQIVRHPLLAKLDLEGTERFCGGEITADDPLQGAYEEIRRHALTIGRRIQSMGYKGIFGIDCLVDEHGKVFVLEINPRITGLTPLLTQLYRPEQDIPFYLLHVLELADLPYEITDTTVAETPASGGLLLLHSLADQPVRLVQPPASGLYDRSSMAFDKAAIHLSDATSRQLLLQQYVPPHVPINPGGRVLSIYTSGPILMPDDTLTPDIMQVVDKLRASLVRQL